MWTWAEEVPCAWEERRPRSGFRDADESEEEDEDGEDGEDGDEDGE